MHYIQFQLPPNNHVSRRLLLPSWVMGRKRGFAWIALTCLRSHRSTNVWTTQSCSLLTTGFFQVRDQIQVITEPVEPSARPLGLGSKSISQQHAMHASQKSYSIHAESFASTPKSSNKQKKPLLAGGQQVLFLCWPLVKIKQIHIQQSSYQSLILLWFVTIQLWWCSTLAW